MLYMAVQNAFRFVEREFFRLAFHEFDGKLVMSRLRRVNSVAF